LDVFLQKRTQSRYRVSFFFFSPIFPLISFFFFFFSLSLLFLFRFPVLIAIDGINHFWNKCQNIGDPYSTKKSIDLLDAKKLTVSQCFSQLENHSLLNGMVVAAVTSFPTRKYTAINSFYKAHPNLKRTIIPAYGKQEFFTILELWNHKKWIRSGLYSFFLEKELFLKRIFFFSSFC